MAIADEIGRVISSLMKVTDTSDATQNLMTALRTVQNLAGTQEVPAHMTPSEATSKFIETLDAGVLSRLGLTPLQLQWDLAIAVADVIPHFGKYELDSGWLGSLLSYRDNVRDEIPFPAPPMGYDGTQPLVSPDANGEIRIGLVGDWGVDPKYGSVRQNGGFTPGIAKTVIHSMAAHNLHYAIHLGDVYYAGTVPEEQENVIGAAPPPPIAVWPFNPPQTKSFALNSNHEMYSNGAGYYALLADPRFAAQRGIGYFALYNDHWLIIGLDTAFFGRWTSRLYQDGTLGDPGYGASDGMAQRRWLRTVLNDPQHARKRVIILTHHDGFDVNPGTGKTKTSKSLWAEMTAGLRGSAGMLPNGELSGLREWWWYWGHVHAPIVYDDIKFSDGSVGRPRCAGHGAIPYLPFPKNYPNFGDSTVKIKWAEVATENPNPTDGTDKDRAPNGFVLITLTGTTIKEEFYSENGHLRWSN